MGVLSHGSARMAFLHALASSPPAACRAAEAGALLACKRGLLDVQRRIGTAPEAAAHTDTSTAAVGEAASTISPGVRARTAPGDRAESLPRRERRIGGGVRPPLRARRVERGQLPRGS